MRSKVDGRKILFHFYAFFKLRIINEFAHDSAGDNKSSFNANLFVRPDRHDEEEAKKLKNAQTFLTRSVTRFGQILPLWARLVFGQILSLWVHLVFAKILKLKPRSHWSVLRGMLFAFWVSKNI